MKRISSRAFDRCSEGIDAPGLLAWPDDEAVRRGLVLPMERELMVSTDDPAEVVEMVGRGYVLQAESLSA